MKRPIFTHAKPLIIFGKCVYKECWSKIGHVFLTVVLNIMQ